MNSSSTSLSIVHINVRGLRANGHLLHEYLERLHFPDIICINESKLNSRIDAVLPNYFCAARKDSLHGHHGSVIFIKDGITDVHELSELKESFNEEVIGVRIAGKQNRPTTNVLTYYNPPGKYVNPAIFHFCKSQRGATILTGDLNCKNSSWGSTFDDRQGDHLLHTLNETSLAILNDGSMTRCDPIHGTEQALDIVVCNRKALSYFEYFYVGHDVGSDHFPIITKFHMLCQETATHSRFIKNTDWNTYKENLKSFTIDRLATPEDVNNAVAKITAAMIDAFEKACPLTKKRVKKCNFTPEMLAIVKEKRRLRRQKSNAMREGDRQTAAALQKEINRKNKELKRHILVKCKSEINRDCQKLSNEKDRAKFSSCSIVLQTKNKEKIHLVLSFLWKTERKPPMTNKRRSFLRHI